MYNIVLFLLILIINYTNSNACNHEFTEHFPDCITKVNTIPHSISIQMNNTLPTLDDCRNFGSKRVIEDDKFVVFQDEVFRLGTGEEGSVWLAFSKDTQEYLAAKSCMDDKKSSEKTATYRALLKLNRLKGLVEKSDNWTYIISNLIVGNDFCQDYKFYPYNVRTDEGRVLICLNYLKEFKYLADKGICIGDLNCGHNIMANNHGHVFMVDLGDAFIQNQASEKYPLGFCHLTLMRDLWRMDAFQPNHKYLTDEMRIKIQTRPYGEFILALFENAGDVAKDRVGSKDVNYMFTLLNNLMIKNNHSRRVVFNTKDLNN